MSTEPASQAVQPRKGYSPFQTEGKMDFALARLDDLVNWARKVLIELLYCIANVPANKCTLSYSVCCMHTELTVAADIWSGVLCCGNDALCCPTLRHGSVWCGVSCESSTG